MRKIDDSSILINIFENCVQSSYNTFHYKCSRERNQSIRDKMRIYKIWRNTGQSIESPLLPFKLSMYTKKSTQLKRCQSRKIKIRKRTVKQRRKTFNMKADFYFQVVEMKKKTSSTLPQRYWNLNVTILKNSLITTIKSMRIS